MRIYFAGAISGGRDHAAVYAHIVTRLQARGHIVPSAHVADLSVATYKSLDELDVRLDSFLDSLIAGTMRV